MPEFISATAEMRGEYRYTLTRVWDLALPMITFVLLNPSTADAVQLDPTLRRCVGFAKREGYGGMVILNLYAFRTKDPKVMMAAADPVGPDNDRILADVTGTVVAGWGHERRPGPRDQGAGAAAATSRVGRHKGWASPAPALRACRCAADRVDAVTAWSSPSCSTSPARRSKELQRARAPKAAM